MILHSVCPRRKHRGYKLTYHAYQQLLILFSLSGKATIFFDGLSTLKPIKYLIVIERAFGYISNAF